MKANTEQPQVAPSTESITQPDQVNVIQQQHAGIPKNKASHLTIVLIILFLVAIGVAGYFGYENFISKNTKIVTPPPPEPPIRPTDIPDTTTNWKTYTNKKLRFTFEYPSYWMISGFPGDEENYENSSSTYTRFKMEGEEVPSQPVSQGKSQILSLTVIDESTDLFIKDSCDVEELPSSVELIDNIQFKKQLFTNQCIKSGMIFFYNASKNLRLGFYYKLEYQTEAELIIAHILTTFKFIN